MWLKWFPWKYLIRRLARTHGFLDPIALMSHLQRFAKPSEVAEPLELLRAGVLLHARGLVNRKVIQHNLDWVWPYWVEKQFDPASDSFIPRAFSISHVNLTHRNWTAVGLPGNSAFSLVDPRGLITPHWDGWSLDGWIVTESGDALCPSREPASEQRLVCDHNRLSVHTHTYRDPLTIRSETYLTRQNGVPVCHVDYGVQAGKPAWFVLALRPYNPEGISFVNKITLDPDRRSWEVDKKHTVHFSRPADRHVVSTYADGDLFSKLLENSETSASSCDAGLATAAGMFKLEENQEHRIQVTVDSTHPKTDDEHPALDVPWNEALQPAAQLNVPEASFVELYHTAVYTLVLLSPGSVYPGPYTYKRFWYRDAAFMTHALLCTGFKDRVGYLLERFPLDQKLSGYFHSQSGEWDSNGEVLWTLARYARLTGRRVPDHWRKAVQKGARWICRKRSRSDQDTLHAGLFPAGFSAEHLGNNDYYYWDDFWGIAGLEAAIDLCRDWDQDALTVELKAEAAAFREAVHQSWDRSQGIRNHSGFPASPYRRMDAGAVGSLVASYPLTLFPPDDARVLATCNFLLEHCLINGAFFQDMTHSGLNAYLTLHLAQVLLRAGDMRFQSLIEAVADLATPTGQWPEAIHPRTRGGCMGDGQHGWAAAEWVMMMRHLFVREEPDHLVVGSGLFPQWLTSGATLHYGPTPTAYGDMDITVSCAHTSCEVEWNGQWRSLPPRIRICIPGFDPVEVDAGRVGHITVRRTEP